MIIDLTDVALKATLVLVMAALTTALMRRASAASRHLVWTSALAATLVLPIARVVLPPLSIPVLPAAAGVATVGDGRRLEARPAGAEITAPASRYYTTPARNAAPMSAADLSRPSGWSAGAILLGVWIAGVVFMLLRSAAGTLGIRRLARRSRRVDDARLLGRVQQIAGDLRVRRPVVTLVGRADAIPVTWGIVYPTILLPSSAAAWSQDRPSRLDAVLVHELGHVARLDALSHLIGRAALAWLWFHPLAWIAVRQARLERERACDDLVLAHGSIASHYADDLLALVQALTPPASADAALAMARRSQFEGRLLAILDGRINRRGLSRTSVAVAAVLLALVLPVAAARAVARPDSASDAAHLSNTDQPARDAARLALELDKLQGVWTVVSLETDGSPMPPNMLAGARIVVTGNRFATQGMGAPFAGTLTLDLAGTLKKIDLHYTDGPETGRASLAIYDIDQHRWRMCLSLAGGTRPSVFATTAGSGHALEVLEREADRPEPTPSQTPHQTSAIDDEMAKLGGEWTVVSIESSGQKLPDMYLQGGTRVMRGKELTVTVAGQVQVKATMTIDPSKSPKTFDYLLTGGPDAGTTALGIYELSGDILKTNFTPPGQPRPTDFTTKAGDGRTSSVWKRKTQAERAVPNLAGTWVPRDPQKNDALFDVGLANVPGAGSMTITQTASMLTIARAIPSDLLARLAAIQGANTHTVSAYYLDGRPSNDRYSGSTTLAHWDSDRLALTTSAQQEWTTYYSIENGDLKVESVGRNDVVLFYRRAPAPASIAGTWRLTFQNQAAVDWTLELALDGTRVTGRLTGRAPEMTVVGEFSNGVLTFTNADQRPDDVWQTVYRAELKSDDALAGTAIASSHDSSGNPFSKRVDWKAARVGSPRP